MNKLCSEQRDPTTVILLTGNRQLLIRHWRLSFILMNNVPLKYMCVFVVNSHQKMSKPKLLLRKIRKKILK